MIKEGVDVMDLNKMYKGKNWFLISLFSSLLRNMVLANCTIISSLVLVIFFNKGVSQNTFIIRVGILTILALLKYMKLRIPLKNDYDNRNNFMIFILIDALIGLLVLIAPYGFILAITVLSIWIINAFMFAITQQITLKKMKEDGSIDRLLSRISEFEPHVLDDDKGDKDEENN